MTDHDELIACYQAMTPWARGKLLRAARDFSRSWPAKPPPPKLRLVLVAPLIAREK